MNKNNIKGCLILALTSLIWGVAFIAQSVGNDHVGPMTFTFCRSLLAVAVLLPASLIGGKRPMGRALGYADKTLLKSGALAGVFLFSATACQQIGLRYTTAGKAAFITALYIVFTPIAAVLLGKKTAASSWLGIIFGGIGMYLLCMTGESGMGRGDLIVLACAMLFTGQILVIDRYSRQVDCIRMSCVQFAVSSLLSGILMLALEKPDISAVMSCAVPILYAGILSSGVAYTLQIIGQKHADVTTATLTMSLESVFAAIAGYLILNEKMNGIEILGCILIFTAIIVAQIPDFKAVKREKRE